MGHAAYIHGKRAGKLCAGALFPEEELTVGGSIVATRSDQLILTRMKQILGIFRIKREERPMVLIMLLVFVALNGMLIYHYYGLFTPEKQYYWPLFVRNFHVSGF